MNIGDYIVIEHLDSDIRGRIVSFDENTVCVDCYPNKKGLIYIPQKTKNKKDNISIPLFNVDDLN